MKNHEIIKLPGQGACKICINIQMYFITLCDEKKTPQNPDLCSIFQNYFLLKKNLFITKTDHVTKSTLGTVL